MKDKKTSSEHCSSEARFQAARMVPRGQSNTHILALSQLGVNAAARKYHSVAGNSQEGNPCVTERKPHTNDVSRDYMRPSVRDICLISSPRQTEQLEYSQQEWV